MDDRITPDSLNNSGGTSVNQAPQQQPPVTIQQPQPVNPAPVQPPVTQQPPIQPVQNVPLTMQSVEEVPELPNEPAPVQQAPQALTASEKQFLGPQQPMVAPVNDEAYYKEESDKKAHKMKSILDAQPKVMTLVPLAPGENAESWEYVGINGYPIWIKKGVYVEVPQQVAQILAESYNLTYAIGKEHLIDARKDRLDALR